MTTSNTDSRDLSAARQWLAQFSCLEVAPALTEADRAAVRETLRWFSELADYETLGICADTLAAGQAAMESYVAALARPIQVDLPAQEGPVYLKFNTLKGAWYLDSYGGPSRGVLVSYHASEPDADPVNGTYGPFPLDLFGDR